MAYLSNEVFLGRHRSVYSIAAIGLLLFVVFKTRLAEAFLAFCFAGVVPGTDIVLSPDTIIFSVIGIFVISIAAFIVRAQLVRARRNRHQWKVINAVPVRTAEPVQIPVRIVTAQPEPAEVSEAHTAGADRTALLAAKKTAVKERRANAAARRARMQFLLSALLRQTGDAFGTVAAAAGGVARALALGIRTAVRASLFGLTKTALFLVQFAKVTGRNLLNLASASWQLAEPLLWKADEWLELQVRRFEAWNKRRIESSPALRTGVQIARDYRKTLKPVALPAAARTAPTLTDKLGLKK